MSIVHAAYDPELDRNVAIKLVRGNDLELGGSGRGRARLVREAQTMAKLSHPNVVTVYDVGIHDGSVYIAMELVEGQGLDEWLAQLVRPWREVLSMFFQAGLGLAAAHDVGIAHRDFKPSNVLVGDDGRARVVDFGLARPSQADGSGGAVLNASAVDLEGAATVKLDESTDAGEDEITMTGVVLGTPAYMAPELHDGREADLRADEFAFCVSLYEGVYGTRPFAGETLEERAAEVRAGRVRPPPPGTRVPRWLYNIIVRGLSFRPESRHPTMKSLLAAIAFTEKIMGG
jgi:serine/threonine protein kinase